MKALVITKHGAPEVLKIEERPDPQPKQGEIVVNVKAVGINFADLMARTGLYPDAPKPPCIVGYEFAGEVDAANGDANGFKAGDRVFGGSRFGGYAEKVAAPSNALIALPEDWSFEQGAAFPVAYGTAYAGLKRYGALEPGERVLIQAAAGGVGIAATQIAKALGAEVFGTASASKHEVIRGFGVDHPIDYRNKDFVAETRRIAGEKEPLDLVMDAIGGKSFKKSFSLLRPGGRLVCFGASSAQTGERRNIPEALKMLAQTPRYNPLKLSSDSKAVIGLNMLRLWDAKGSLDEYIEPLANWIADGTLKPVVAESFPLERGPEAHRYIAEGKNIGKVVLTP